MGCDFLINDIYQRRYLPVINSIIMGDGHSGHSRICSSGADWLLDESIWSEADSSYKPLILILPVYYLSLADSFTDLLISGLFLGLEERYFRSVLLLYRSTIQKIGMDLSMEFMESAILEQRLLRLEHLFLQIN